MSIVGPPPGMMDTAARSRRTMTDTISRVLGEVEKPSGETTLMDYAQLNARHRAEANAIIAAAPEPKARRYKLPPKEPEPAMHKEEVPAADIAPVSFIKGVEQLGYLFRKPIAYNWIEVASKSRIGNKTFRVTYNFNEEQMLPEEDLVEYRRLHGKAIALTEWRGKLTVFVKKNKINVLFESKYFLDNDDGNILKEIESFGARMEDSKIAETVEVSDS